MSNRFSSSSPLLFSLAIITLSGTILFPALLTTAAQAQTPEPNSSRMIWQTTRPVNDQRDLANSVLGGLWKDYIIFHYGSGSDPTSAQITAMKQVTTTGDLRKGFEFFSLAELAEHAPTAAANGLGVISYDLEGTIGNGPSPDIELADPVAAVTEARQIARDNGLTLQIAPSNAISSGQYADDIAALTNRYHLQSQPKQDDDTTCAIMDSWVADRVSVLEGAQSGLETKITAQVTLTGNAAPGKTAYQTAKDCIDAIANDDVDGFSIWWGGAQWDDGTYQQLLTYYEDTYS